MSWKRHILQENHKLMGRKMERMNSRKTPSAGATPRKVDSGLSKSSSMSWWWQIPMAIYLTIVILALGRNHRFANDPLIYFIPNTLLYTPFRGLTHLMWDLVLEYDTSREIPLIPIPEIDARDFTFEALKEATENFHYPVVVRGLFQNTTAVEQWHTRDYVASHIGDYEVAFLQRGAAHSLENDRKAMYVPFRNAWTELLGNRYSPKYLFFPEMSRVKKSTEKELFNYDVDLRGTLNKMMRDDLDLDRIWPGFGSEKHSTYMGTQFIAGWGQGADRNSTTGSNWHCAPGNNWFIQVHGRKRWLFVDQIYSAYMHPQRDGVHTIATSSRNMIEMEKYLPVKYVDLEAGDMVYNPDLEWHAIRNHEGLSIGVPIREFNRTLSRQNNLHYYLLFGINHFLARVGITYGLQPHLKV